MAERTGSYPLMNLAADYGVAYADVLLWADYIRRGKVDRGPVPEGVRFLAAAACCRIGDVLNTHQVQRLHLALIDHADARWGRP